MEIKEKESLKSENMKKIIIIMEEKEEEEEAEEEEKVIVVVPGPSSKIVSRMDDTQSLSKRE